MTSSKRSSTITERRTMGFWWYLIFIWSKISLLFLVSYIPSHPNNIHYSYPVMFNSKTSGNAEIIYSFWGKLEFFLKSRSPIAHERFKDQLILPSKIKPPAQKTLFFSYLRSGLWSWVIWMTSRFFFCKIARESPELAIIILSSDKSMTKAVHPENLPLVLDSLISFNI